jgi:uncharacterized caspase-like protein
MRALRVILLVVGLICASLAPAIAGKRVALVIGNSGYQNNARLTNPANDSAAMADALRSAGFDTVDLKRDLNASMMRRALRDFADAASDADVAIIYYAGHGVEIDGTNYLIPIDAVLQRDIDAYDEAIPMDRLLSVIEPARKLRLVILDACRDNPFARTIQRTNGTRGVGRGLARIEPASSNTLVAFAARAGSTAVDGSGSNSPFTAAVVKYLVKPGLDVRRAFGFTRDEVLKVTNNRQEPFIYGSLGGDDFPLVPAPAPPAAAPDPNQGIRHDYEIAERIGTRDAWDSFLSTYPEGFYAKLAQAQRNKLAAEEARIAANKTTQQQTTQVTEAERVRQAQVAKVADAERIAADNAKATDAAKAADAVTVSGTKSQDATQLPGDAARPVGPLAALSPPGDRVPPAGSAETIARTLQNELHRVGCGSGPVSESWDSAAEQALRLFNRNVGTRFDVHVASADALDTVRGKSGRICPLICRHGFRPEGDHCEKIVCRDGYQLNDDNSCERVAREKRRNDKPAPVANTERNVAPAPDRQPEQVEAGSARRTEALYAQCRLQMMRSGSGRSRGPQGNFLRLDGCVRNGGRL